MIDDLLSASRITASIKQTDGKSNKQVKTKDFHEILISVSESDYLHRQEKLLFFQLLHAISFKSLFLFSVLASFATLQD